MNTSHLIKTIRKFSNIGKKLKKINENIILKLIDLV